MTILVVGATGTLGRQIVRRALDEGHQVRCLVRVPTKANFLREWGADLTKGSLLNPESLDYAMEGVTMVIDAATARPSSPIRPTDWDGKVALIQAAVKAKVERFVFCSIVDAEKYPTVPLMDIKTCTEKFLAESGLNYTVLRLSGFFQGLISQYAIPVIEGQTVWVTGEAAPIAYMNTQDIAKFAVKALSTPATENRCFPVVGPRAWGTYEIVRLCERLTGRDAKIARMQSETVRFIRRVVGFFQWGNNLAERLAFTDVVTSGDPLDADMAPVYEAFGLDPAETTTLEDYLEEYFSKIMKKLKELNYDSKKDQKKKLPF
jgi:uncharacterized protein YbjT (DUF2867 family)